MSDTSDRATVRVPPPLVFLGVIVLAAGLHRLLPLTFDTGGIVRAVAMAVALGGGGLIAAALVHFVRTGQNPEPWKPTPAIVQAGVFRWSRNPMYLGMALLQLAAGLWQGNLWWCLLVPLSMLAVHRLAIRHEEAYLARKFGEDYLEYRRSVRRWL